MNQTIRVLLVEDSETDALLLLRQLEKSGYRPVSKRVDSAPAMLAALEKEHWDIVISDFVVPGFSGLDALELMRSKGLDLPFIIVSGQIGEDIAVQAMKAGAHDYLMKDKLARLVPAVERELREAEMRRKRREADERLKATAKELLHSNEELRKLEEELRTRNEELVLARDELEAHVIKRTAALSKANAELRHQMEERKRLEQELLEITEQERQRIGIDLHDDLGQQLTGLAFMVKGLQQKLVKENSQRAAEAEKVHAVVCQSIQRAHDLALDLASDFDGENLGLALEQLAQRVRNLFGVDCQFTSEGEPIAFSPSVAAHFFKIAQEALTNGIKHGKARRLSLLLDHQPERVILRVRNDGVPFPSEASKRGRMGLRIMKYRAHVCGAALEVGPGDIDGTDLICALPLVSEGARAPQRELAIDD